MHRLPLPPAARSSDARPMRVRLAPLLLAAAALAPAALAPVAVAQTTFERSVRVDALGVLPTAGLATRFGPTASASAAYGWSIGPTRRLELVVSGVRFTRGDLQLSGDTTGVGSGPVSSDSLDVSLSLVGAGLRFHQTVATVGPATARAVLGGGFTHWVDRRGSYPSRGLTDGTRRAQWSGEFVAGAGLDVPLAGQLSATAEALYHFLPADLWGAQQVRLRPVSTFQYATLGVGVRVGL